MKVLRITLAVLMMVVVFSSLLGCEEEVITPPKSQEDWTADGWAAWTAGDFDDAITFFGNAVKIDGNYMPAYNGFGWTYMRLQDTESSVNYFEDGVLYGAGYPNADDGKRAIYVGLAYALEASDDFVGAISAGNTYLAMDPPPATTGGAGGTWVHPYDARLTAYDAWIILAVCFFAQGNSGRCVDMVHYMQRDIKETPEYTFTTWSNLADKIEDMVIKDPS